MCMKSGISLRPCHTAEKALKTENLLNISKKYLHLKQEASGYPTACVSEEDREKFKRDNYKTKGIKLHHVEKNIDRRTISKIMLNSLWG